MAEGSLNIGELVRQLGLKNVRELPVTERIQPVIIVADGAPLVAPLIPPMAWSGEDNLAVVGERNAWQFLARRDCFVRLMRIAGSDSCRVRIDRDGTDPLAADPLSLVGPIFNLGPTNVLSTTVFGSTTVLIAAAFADSHAFDKNVAWDVEWFLPKGSLLTLQHTSVDLQIEWSVLWTEVLSPALTPTG